MDQPVSSNSSNATVSLEAAGTAATPSSIWRIRLSNEIKPPQTTSTTATTTVTERKSTTEDSVPTTTLPITSITEETSKERPSTSPALSSITSQLPSGKNSQPNAPSTSGQQSSRKKLPQTGEKESGFNSVVGIIALMTILFFRKRGLDVAADD